jgi:hypothetical protein
MAYNVMIPGYGMKCTTKAWFCSPEPQRFVDYFRMHPGSYFIVLTFLSVRSEKL